MRFTMLKCISLRVGLRAGLSPLGLPIQEDDLLFHSPKQKQELKWSYFCIETFKLKLRFRNRKKYNDKENLVKKVNQQKGFAME